MAGNLRRKGSARRPALYFFIGALAAAPFQALPARAQSDASFSPQAGVSRDRSSGDASLERLLAQKLGMRDPYRVESARLGNSMNNVVKLTFDDGRRREPVVVKRFKGVMGVVKTLGRKMSFQEKFQNEIAMNAAFNAAGLRTLEILFADPDKRIIVTRFLEGGVLMQDVVARARAGDPESLELVERLGASLAVAHQNGLTIEDLKPDNVMVKNGEIVFIDLDLAKKGDGDKAMDVAKFAYRSAASHEDGLVARAFLNGYLANGGSPQTVREAMSLRYLSMLITIAQPSAILPQPIREVRHEMREALEGRF